MQKREILGTLLVAGVSPLVTAAYVGFLVRVRQRHPDSLAFFRSLGRMSLTTYLAQSILLCVVFCGWGLELFGKLSNPSMIAIAMSIYAALAVFAKIWLARFDQGPMEWLMKKWCQLAKYRGA
jgi:uncharacterized protein